MGRAFFLCLILSLAAPQALIAADEPEITDSTAEVAPADDKEVALDALLKQLKNAPDEKAAKVVEEAVWQLWLRSGSDTIDLLMSRVVGAMKKEDFSLALDLLNHIVELKPGYAEGWNKRATVFFHLEDYARSLHDVERTLALEPRHFGALSGLGLILQELGEDENALRAFRQALAVNPYMSAIRKAEKNLADKVEGRGI